MTENWCEIFRTGKHTDANGVEKDWTEEDLDTIVTKFNENKPKAPCVIGHPKSNNPAYGWVKALKREGERLFAAYKDTVPQFAEWVNKGLYPNRSISLYPDLTLRHVGFLGAVPPAIKGLEEFQFSEKQEGFVYEFSDSTDFKFRTLADVLQDLRDFLISKYDIETADQIISNWKIDDLKLVDTETEDEIKQFTESLINPKSDAAPAVPSEFSEKLTEKDAKISELQAQLDKERAEKRHADFEQFAEECLQGGHITPAQKPELLGFMEICHLQGTYDFAEGEEKSVLKRFQTFIKSGKQIDFSEIAIDGKPKDKQSLDFSEPRKAAAKIRALADEKGISEIEAMELLQNGKEK